MLICPMCSAIAYWCGKLVGCQYQNIPAIYL
jgi:hypothetical protein